MTPDQPSRLTEDERFWITEARRLAALRDITDYPAAYEAARIVLAETALRLEELGGGNKQDPGGGTPSPGEGITGLHWDNLGSGGAQ